MKKVVIIIALVALLVSCRPQPEGNLIGTVNFTGKSMWWRAYPAGSPDKGDYLPVMIGSADTVKAVPDTEYQLEYIIGRPGSEIYAGTVTLTTAWPTVYATFVIEDDELRYVVEHSD